LSRYVRSLGKGFRRKAPALVGKGKVHLEKKAAKEGKPTTSTSQLADADPKDIQINLRAVSVGTLARNNIPRIAMIVPCR
jgi:16S rRNA U516 pseudouridylate synthase RsuA-like enzyme